MTQKEEIEQATPKNRFVNFHKQVAYEFGFQQGAEWADKTMIDKACKYIEENFIDADEKGVVKSYDFDSVKDMLDNFRKTMEE